MSSAVGIQVQGISDVLRHDLDLLHIEHQPPLLPALNHDEALVDQVPALEHVSRIGDRSQGDAHRFRTHEPCRLGAGCAEAIRHHELRDGNALDICPLDAVEEWLVAEVLHRLLRCELPNRDGVEQLGRLERLLQRVIWRQSDVSWRCITHCRGPARSLPERGSSVPCASSCPPAVSGPMDEIRHPRCAQP